MRYCYICGKPMHTSLVTRWIGETCHDIHSKCINEAIKQLKKRYEDNPKWEEEKS